MSPSWKNRLRKFGKKLTLTREHPTAEQASTPPPTQPQPTSSPPAPASEPGPASTVPSPPSPASGSATETGRRIVVPKPGEVGRPATRPQAKVSEAQALEVSPEVGQQRIVRQRPSEPDHAPQQAIKNGVVASMPMDLEGAPRPLDIPPEVRHEYGLDHGDL